MYWSYSIQAGAWSTWFMMVASLPGLRHDL